MRLHAEQLPEHGREIDQLKKRSEAHRGGANYGS